MIRRRDRRGARLTTSAIAWELSRAGRIPSVRASRWKAEIASASVADEYSTRPASCRKTCSGPIAG